MLCRELDSNIRYRLCMCIWKHWKTPQNRAKNLMKLGIPRWAAFRTAYNGAKIARVCSMTDIQRAISPKRLNQFGLISMLDYYTERLLLVKLIESLCTEPYARWCERSGKFISDFPAYSIL